MDPIHDRKPPELKLIDRVPVKQDPLDGREEADIHDVNATNLQHANVWVYRESSLVCSEAVSLVQSSKFRERWRTDVLVQGDKVKAARKTAKLPRIHDEDVQVWSSDKEPACITAPTGDMGYSGAATSQHVCRLGKTASL